MFSRLVPSDFAISLALISIYRRYKSDVAKLTTHIHKLRLL